MLAKRKRPGYWKPEDGYGFSLESAADAKRDVTIPGPLLVLQRGQPVEILLKNELPESTATHWHRAGELLRRCPGMERLLEFVREHDAHDRARRIVSRAVHSAARGHVHLSHAFA